MLRHPGSIGKKAISFNNSKAFSFNKTGATNGLGKKVIKNGNSNGNDARNRSSSDVEKLIPFDDMDDSVLREF